MSEAGSGAGGRLIGHLAEVAEFTRAVASGRAHHGWILAGRPGLGKALFAQAAASWLLADTPAGAGFEAADGSEAAAMVAAGSHPDFRRLERRRDEKGKQASVITVEDVREMEKLLHSTPSLGGWRVVIIDSLDELNRNAANALLKSLEEPPRQTLFLLVCHAPGRLLPTLRSRCRLLRFHPLDDRMMAEALAAELPALSQADRAALIRLSGGVPGMAIALAEPGIAALEGELAQLVQAPPAEAAIRAAALARSLSGKAGAARLSALLARAPALLAEGARSRRGAALARTIDDWQAAQSLATGAGPLSLDPQTVAYDLASRLARLGGN